MSFEKYRERYCGSLDYYDEDLIKEVWDYQQKKIDELQGQIETLSARLEIDPRHSYDGIACRDETIKLVERENAKLQEKTDELEVTVDMIVSINKTLLDLMQKGVM